MSAGDRDLIAELEALLERAAVTPSLLAGRTPPPRQVTPWQDNANELCSLCRRVLEEADDETGRAFWLFLISVAARHGRRAGGWPA